MYNLSDDFIKKIYKLFKAKILPDGLKTGFVKTGMKADVTPGTDSTAEGYDNSATGQSSHCEGETNTASGSCSHAGGWTCTASGAGSFAHGYNCTASGDYSFAMGGNCTASSSKAFALGGSCTASGDGAFALGSMSTAEGLRSCAIGSSTEAKGTASHAIGNKCKTVGNYSFAGGALSSAYGGCNFVFGQESVSGQESSPSSASQHIISMGYHCLTKYQMSVAMGRYNTDNSLDSIFMIGNGSASYDLVNGGSTETRSNAFRIADDGSVYGQSAFNSSGADYAEFFEWADYNMKNEDRRGYFVTFDNEDKIRIANPNDAYILGIVSSNPVIVGNSDPDGWSKRFLKDEFGNYIMEEVKDLIPVDIDEDGNNIYEEYTTEAHVINPDFNPEKEDIYVPRSERQEWSPIGMLGQLIVRDDGTCEVNKNCVVGDGGIATLSSDSSKGWRVIKRVNDHLVKILFR